MDFQTPHKVCDYMVELTLGGSFESDSVLEPTPGEGNLVCAIKKRYNNVKAPNNFWSDINPNERFDAIIMNPPFSPMEEGYRYLDRAMAMSDHIVALLPWLVIINSKKRTKKIIDFGLVTITHLPRDVFPGSRIQCCILHMIKGWKRQTVFKSYDI